MESLWSPGGVLWSPCGVHPDSIWTLQGLRQDSTRTPSGLHQDSVRTPQDYIRTPSGLHRTYPESIRSPSGLVGECKVQWSAKERALQTWFESLAPVCINPFEAVNTYKTWASEFS